MASERGADNPSLADLVERGPEDAVTSINSLLIKGTSFRELQRQILDAAGQVSLYAMLLNMCPSQVN
jgi:hypothetical protein